MPASLVAATVMSAAMSVGGVESRTTTSKLAVPTLPSESAAEHCTVVVPSRNSEPLAGVHVTALGRSGTPSSAAVTEYPTFEPDAPFASTTSVPGVVNVGGVVSTLHVRVAVAEFEAASVARTRNVCGPGASPEYDCGDEHAVNEPESSEQESVPSFVPKPKLAFPVATVPDGPEVIETDGGVVSWTTTLKRHRGRAEREARA
jgi:hypothetical protein